MSSTTLLLEVSLGSMSLDDVTNGSFTLTLSESYGIGILSGKIKSGEVPTEGRFSDRANNGAMYR